MLQNNETDKLSNRHQMNADLDRLEKMINDLRILYEQYFLEILTKPPEKPHKDVKKFVRRLMKSPFMNSQTRFRMRQVVYRFQTYETYWARVLRQREEGTYSKDVFKAQLREREVQENVERKTRQGQAEAGFKQLYDSYEAALKKCGARATNMDFGAFRETLVKRAKALKEQHGAKKISYKVVVRDGKAIIKASAKE
ncbi:MAG: hypothetical protein KDD44_07315 [Bdellovibrionales bacterium]|nr:hypothetical protein [Bdellovibrionales bacterium]